MGLLIKEPKLRESLGEMLVPMLTCMGDRGPDSAGLALFSTPLPQKNARRFSLFCAVPEAWKSFQTALHERYGSELQLTIESRHGVALGEVDPHDFRTWIKAFPDIHLLSIGRTIDVIKDEGHPRDISARYGFSQFQGTHAVGHTRMATESAVSPAHAHPFTAGEDFCLVHNGSLSNPYSIRRKLERRGVSFETDNDTEAACRFLEWRMREGNTLEDALAHGFQELDGFYTLLMGTANKLVLVRDAFACKPAVVAETDAYVAVGSEFRALAHLPGVHAAHLFEPEPERIYSWNVSQSA